MEPLFDTDLVRQRRLRALRAAVPGADFLMRHVCDDLAERLSAVERRFPVAADLFSGSAIPANTLLESGKVGEVIRIETDDALFGAIGASLDGMKGLVAPPETVKLLPESIDLAVSVLALQQANDVPGMLIQARRALRPDGLFLAAMAGQGTLAELRESLLAAEAELSGGVSPRVAPFAEVREAGALLQRAGFALPVADVEPLTVRYDTMFGLMHDLRVMGVTNPLAARTRRPATRAFFARAAEIYAERFSDPDGRVRATFSIIWMSGWAPHASQQQPLRPGSAKVSLASVLGDASANPRDGE